MRARVQLQRLGRSHSSHKMSHIAFVFELQFELNEDLLENYSRDRGTTTTMSRGFYSLKGSGRKPYITERSLRCSPKNVDAVFICALHARGQCNRIIAISCTVSLLAQAQAHESRALFLLHRLQPNLLHSYKDALNTKRSGVHE